MDFLAVLNALAAVTTIVAALLVASNYSPKVMVAGFAIFIAASLMWMTSGFIDNKTSLIMQNSVLLAINCFGIWRWAPRT